MHRPFTRTVSALALVLAAGSTLLAVEPTLAARMTAAKPLEPARIAQATTHLHSLKSQLGLSEAADFKLHHAFTNELGTTIVRLQQTHQGHTVLSGSAIVHVGANGAVQKVIPAVAAGIQLSGAPSLTAEQAKAIALKNLAAKGPFDGTPTVTQVVFSSRNTGGFTTKLDPATGKVVLDKELSTWAKRPAADYVWAYAVSTSLRNSLDGMKQISYIIDGNTGVILRKWNNLKSDSPKQGTGNSLYNGTVVLHTAQSSTDNTYYIADLTRGSKPSYNFQTADPITRINNTGLQTYFCDLYQGYWGLTLGAVPFAGNTTNVWGNGQPFLGMDYYTDPGTGNMFWTGAPDANGQTAAVDAQFGLATTWDLFSNVFGRNGMDGNGLTLDAQVHDIVPVFMGTGFRKRTNHFFSGGSGWFSWGLGTMYLGDGSYPEDPNGTYPQTEIDIVGHEATHALTYATINFDPNASEPPVMEEALCDIFGMAVKAYALRAPGADSTIPDFPATFYAGFPSATSLDYWTFGYQADRGTPERYFYKPSLDGLSPDGWFDGIGILWPWYASGPINRSFFFLSAGSSSVSTDPNYSSYLPAGMTGIGIDKAVRIWYKALTENMTAETTFADALTATDAAATALYGAGSTEELAVLNAFYAANIGNGAPGQPKHVQVTLPLLHPAGSLLGTGGTNWQGFPAGHIATFQFWPPATPVKLMVDVANSTNTAVTWSAGGIGLYGTDIVTAGTFNADGTWTTPVSPNSDWEPIVLKVASQADPSQYAKAQVFIVSIDADMDSENDALDLGVIAMTWGMANNPLPSVNIWSSGAPGDWDVALFNEVLTNTYPVQVIP